MQTAKKRIIFGAAILVGVVAIVIAAIKIGAGDSRHFEYSFASTDEGIELMLGNSEYYAGFSQNDLDYKTQKLGATMEEYQTFARTQVLQFSEEEKNVIDKHMTSIEQTILEKKFNLPDLDPIVFIKTTQDEECGSGAYTHGTHIYLGDYLMDLLSSEDENTATYGESVLWHEIFHCLTRCNKEFRADMYKIIHFTVQDKDYELPPSVFDFYINNPDVEHHDSYATFTIDGKSIDCFTALVTTKHFENVGDSFFDCMTTALVPIDGTDTYYTPEEASNFDEVFGRNTGYVIDPEECLADNFSYAVIYGMDGYDKQGYPNPEIIEAILNYMK